MPTPQFKLENLLRRHNQSVAGLAKASGLRKSTVANIVNNRSKAVELETLGKLLQGLEKLTGQAISFDDVLTKDPAEAKDARASLSEAHEALAKLIGDAQPMGLERLRSLIPKWTDEERAENERFLEGLEQERQANRAFSEARDRELESIFASDDA